MATLSVQQLDKPSAPASASPRFCDPHRDRAGVNLPATRFVGSQAFCERCFRGDPIRVQDTRPGPLPASESRSPISSQAARRARRGAPLNARERQVAELIAGGRQNKDIALALGITERTVKFHIGEALAKSGTKSRTELAIWFRDTDGEGLDASVQKCLERVERDLRRARAVVSESAGATLRQLRATSCAQQRLAQLENALAALAEFAEAWDAPSEIGRLQDPRRTTPHLGSDELPQRERDLKR